MEIDHIFICVAPGAHEAEALKEFGLTEGSTNQHPGQGTTNRRFFFRNAYIELLYLIDLEEIRSELTNPTQLFERLTTKADDVSPFGICFRPSAGTEEKVPFSSWSYTPSYLPENLKIEIGNAPLSEPMWFFLTFGTRPDNAPRERQHPVEHQKGFGEITSVRVTITDNDNVSNPALCATDVAGFELVKGNTHLIQIGFDNECNGCSHDFRPVLPLVFRW